MNNRKKILVIQPISREALQLFDARDDVEYRVITDFSPENIAANIGEADAITIRDAPLAAEVLERAPNLRIVARHGVGFDNIPVDYCTGRGVPVAVVGDVNVVSVAEHTLFLLLAVAKNGVRFDQAVRRGDFTIRARWPAMELRGKRLLIVGFGRIGQEFAALARALGMAISVHDPLIDRTRFPAVAFADTLAAGLCAADVVSLHVPLVAQTRNLIGAAEFRAMRPHAILINAARGGVVDEAALEAALREGRLRGAGLDTFMREPPDPGDPLLQREDVVLSPHSAALTAECLVAMGVATARNVLATFDGTLDPALVVNRSVLPEAWP